MAFGTTTESGKPVAILDEGLTITPSVSSMNFVGSGVTGTVIGSAVTETIPGGGSGNLSGNEILTNSGDNQNFTFAHSPASILSVWVKETGQTLTNVTDYSISGTTLTLTAAQAGWTIIASYAY